MNQDVIINIDYRESDLYQAFINKTEIQVSKINLQIGDIEIVFGQNKLIFERKTQNDLLSSIKDGRYKEQKTRMLSTYEPHKCCYIIEKTGATPGVIPGAIQGAIPEATPGATQGATDKYAIDSAMIHTMYRDKIHVLETNGVLETAELIIKIATRCQKNPDKFESGSSEGSQYIDCIKVKTKKSDNIDKTTCYLLQLCQIPGISKTIAKEIVKIYPTMKDFYNSEITLEKLRTVPMIGEKKAKIILEYMIR